MSERQSAHGKGLALTPSFTPVPSRVLQRKCACSQHAGGGECADCKKKHDVLQRHPAGNSQVTHVPPIVYDVLRSPGQPLDGRIRAFMEPRMGHDFSSVRVHAGAAAAESAASVNALAYTVGNNLVFNRGQFAPGTFEGRKLIAHELTHVVQQSSGTASAPGDLRISDSNTPQERSADLTSSRVMSEAHGDSSVHNASMAAGGGILQRQPSPGGDQSGGPDYGIKCDILSGKCTATAGGVDVPLSKEQYSCWAQARTPGHCPKECVDVLKDTGVPCTQTEAPTFPGKEKPPTIPGLPDCAPGKIPIAGRCVSFQPPSKVPDSTPTSTPTSTPSSTPSQPSSTPRRQPGRHGTIESATFDSFGLDVPSTPAGHKDALDHLTGLLNIYREVEVHIEGHTDGSGPEAHNEKLAGDRAESIKKELLSRGVVDPARLHTQGFGSQRLLVHPERTKAQEPRNRRVEVWFITAPSKGLGEGLRLPTTP